MSENEEFIYNSIFSQIRMGFYSVEEIKDNVIEEIQDNKFEDEVSKKWAFEIVDEEYKKLSDESFQWKELTDTDKLIDAFDELCKNNIIAIHNAGYTISDGESEVVEIEEELRANDVSSDGYCFYHEQDLQRALKGEGLYISFQKIDNTDDKIAVKVGKKIVEILKKYGFDIKWNEKANQRILIKNFKWRFIYNENGRDLWDYDDVLDIILG